MSKILLKQISRLLSDKAYIKLNYFRHFRKFPDLKNPCTFNEKLQYLKLFDRKDVYKKMADKVEAKTYVAKRIGKQYIIPTYGVYDNFDRIDFDSLPDCFVMKTTHDSGTVFVCKNKRNFDFSYARKQINASLKKDYFFCGREWQYKGLERRIIVEQFLDTGNDFADDYKIFTFNGKAKIIYIRTENGKCGDYFDVDFNHLNLEIDYPNAEVIPEKPKKLNEMIVLAEKLAEGTCTLRVDFYFCNEKIYFGEMTFYHDCGFVHFSDEKYDKILGDMIQLPQF